MLKPFGQERWFLGEPLLVLLYRLIVFGAMGSGSEGKLRERRSSLDKWHLVQPEGPLGPMGLSQFMEIDARYTLLSLQILNVLIVA